MRYLVQERGISISYQNQAINAIKFYRGGGPLRAGPGRHSKGVSD
ncbi:hypothetical protein [Catalinimonas alkaloidigena]